MRTTSTTLMVIAITASSCGRAEKPTIIGQVQCETAASGTGGLLEIDATTTGDVDSVEAEVWLPTPDEYCSSDTGDYHPTYVMLGLTEEEPGSWWAEIRLEEFHWECDYLGSALIRMSASGPGGNTSVDLSG